MGVEIRGVIRGAGEKASLTPEQREILEMFEQHVNYLTANVLHQMDYTAQFPPAFSAVINLGEKVEHYATYFGVPANPTEQCRLDVHDTDGSIRIYYPTREAGGRIELDMIDPDKSPFQFVAELSRKWGAANPPLRDGLRSIPASFVERPPRFSFAPL